jgi:hypothetical protein
MFASKEDIAKASGYTTSAAQILWLKANKIPYRLNAVYAPVVLASTLEELIADAEVRAVQPIPPKTKVFNELGTKFRPYQCGIYFLLKGKVLVYIGQTTNLFQRIAAHQTTEKDFDAFVFMPVEKELLSTYEAEYIAQYKPKYNNIHNPVRPPRRALRNAEKTDVESTPVEQVFAERKMYEVPVFIST